MYMYILPLISRSSHLFLALADAAPPAKSCRPRMVRPPFGRSHDNNNKRNRNSNTNTNIDTNANTNTNTSTNTNTNNTNENHNNHNTSNNHTVLVLLLLAVIEDAVPLAVLVARAAPFRLLL